MNKRFVITVKTEETEESSASSWEKSFDMTPALEEAIGRYMGVGRRGDEERPSQYQYEYKRVEKKVEREIFRFEAERLDFAVLIPALMEAVKEYPQMAAPVR